jgi:integrase
LGKIRALFNNIGRTKDSNPISHPKIKDYVKFVRSEQIGKAITPTQAVPLFLSKLKRLTAHIRNLIAEGANLATPEKYILARDVAFFVVDFFTGDRASDLGRLRAEQVFRMKDREGYLLCFTGGKTTAQREARRFVLVPIPEKDVCPVLWITYYISACDSLGIILTPGYFFRSLERTTAISDRPFAGSAVNNRLRKYLKGAGIDDGETPHSFRVGLSNTLTRLGCSSDQISRYVGWRSPAMARHYTRPSDSSTVLGLFEELASNLSTSLLSDHSDPTYPGNLERAV